MDRCESCDRELASVWKFCIYCGRPTARLTLAGDYLPAAFRPETGEASRTSKRRYDAPFWVGVAMGVLGLALIIYAAIQIYGSYA